MKKTQKSFRKKALLSSLSMLMVATVAVGSATFAWFSQNTTAKATGVNVKTVKGSNLVLSKASDDTEPWVSTLDLGIADKTLEPASTIDCSNWYKAKAGAYNLKATETNGRTEASAIETNEVDGRYIAKTFYVKSIASSITASYTLNVTPTAEDGAETNLDYVRVAVKDAAGTVSSFYGNKAADNKGLTKNAETQNIEPGNQAISSTVTGSLNLTADTPQAITVFIWFEGEDPECIDTKAGVDVKVDVNFAKTGDYTP